MSADDLARILDELGQRLGPTGQHVFDLAIKQTVINGITDLVIATALVIAALIVRRWTERAIVDEDAKTAKLSYHTSEAGLIRLVGYGGTFGICAVALFFGVDGLSRLLNPEYSALRDILSAVAR